MEVYSEGGVIPARSDWGHGYRGVGTMKMSSRSQRGILYGLYLENPSRPLMAI